MTNQSNEHLAIGYKIGGHYKITKVLGQGGFGIVYLVEDIHRLNAQFVIKELFSRDFSFRHRDGHTVYNKAEAKNIFAKIKEDIISEVNILQKIRDKNIVEAYGYFEDNNTLYSVMEFIDGVDLDKYLKKVPPFTEDEAKDLLLQISKGIEKIHAINVLHRDIKPSNIMRTRDGVYKLIDFTTNRTYEDNKLTTVTAFRSPIYTPPELSGNKRAIIGKFSDIYSIGMTICRVLAEDEETLPNITDRLIDDSEFQALINGFDIDDNFKNILRKMTQINAEDRFQDLKDIQKLLNSTQLSEPTQPTKIDKTPKKENSKPKSWFNIIALILSIILIGLGWYAYKIIKDNKEHNKITQQKTNIEVATTNNDNQEEEEEEIKSEIKPLSIPEPT
ncbi:MAG TPA: serine/threonine protein kinase, partial [Campylobacterales bacterium]|nr:serine/threonine protein kinase [Campylobacterales bacterium]